MVFFRKRSDHESVRPPSSEPAVGGAADPLQELVTHRERELRALGEIYYRSAGGGKPDTRALHRKMREIQRLDSELERVPAARRAALEQGALQAGTPAACHCGCGALLHPLDRFCGSCGQATAHLGGERRCLSCRSLIEAADQFCRACGVSTSAAGQVRVRHPLTGQEASFDFQPAPMTMAPHDPGFAAPAEETVYNLGEGEDEADRGGDPSRQWIRELERFARPAQVDSQQLLQRGREFLAMGRFAEAAGEFEAVLALNPRDARAQYQLGVARYQGAELEGAIEAFERAIRLDRHNPDTHNDLGLCYAKQGQRREAMEQYARALAINPGHGDAHYNLAHLYIHQEAYGEAVPHLRAYLQHTPRARDCHEVTELIDQLEAAATGARSLQAPRSR